MNVPVVRICRRMRLLDAAGLALLALSGCAQADTSAPDPTDRAALFGRYWSDFDATYPSFPLKGVNWMALRDTYRSEAAATPSTAALVTVLQQMSGALQDGHARFIRPDGTVQPTWTPTAVVNWDRNQWLGSLASIGYSQVRPNLGFATLPGGIGYVVVGGWNPAQFTAADADAVLDRFRNAPALILDVRMNGGGDDRLAFEVAGRFLSEARSAGSVRVRNGPAYTSLGPPTTLTVTPRGSRLAMPVLLLTGRGVFSSNEAFVEAMRQEAHVTTFGDTTGGSSGNPVTRELAEGWRYTVPTWLHMTRDGQPIEGRGIPPEQYAPWNQAAARAGQDVVLEAALSALRARLGN